MKKYRQTFENTISKNPLLHSKSTIVTSAQRVLPSSLSFSIDFSETYCEFHKNILIDVFPIHNRLQTYTIRIIFAKKDAKKIER